MTKAVDFKIANLGFEDAFLKVQDGIDNILKDSPWLIRPIISYLSASKGKLLRSQILLTASMEGENVHENAVNLGVSIELLHLATLIHDDIIDRSDTRRSLPTVQKKFGNKYAVLAGDYLLAKSLEIISQVPKKKEYADREFTIPNYMSKLILGEIRQHKHHGNLDLGIKEYLKIIHGKTATLFEAASYMGASLINNDDQILQNYRRFGRLLGIVFQISDDILDYESNKGRAGKDVGTDFTKGVITLPLIYAIQNEPQVRKQLKEDKSFNVIDFVKKAGGISLARTFSKKYYEKALNNLENLMLGLEKKQRLKEYLLLAYGGKN